MIIRIITKYVVGGSIFDLCSLVAVANYVVSSYTEVVDSGPCSFVEASNSVASCSFGEVSNSVASCSYGEATNYIASCSFGEASNSVASCSFGEASNSVVPRFVNRSFR